MRLLAPVLSLFLVACGGREPAPEVIAKVGGKDAGSMTQDLDELARADAKLAASILGEALAGTDGDLAAWAAVHSCRLGLKSDDEKIDAALIGGAASKDSLLATLAWRWLAVRGTPLPDPGKAAKAMDEPVLEAMIYAAHVAREVPAPPAVRAALSLPAEGSGLDGPPNHRAVTAIEASIAPFDDGPLAAAVAFAVARRDGWKDGGDWWADRARRRLLVELEVESGEADAVLADLPRSVDLVPTRLLDRLDLAIASSPRALLRNVALSGRGPLRIDALRALAVVAKEPQAGDLGAASAAMRSQDATERVEAARTFLLLVARCAR